MKCYTIILFFSFFSLSLFAQTEAPKEKLYNPEADAAQQIEQAVTQAKEDGKHVFLQLGGNWCGWCIKFHHFCKDDKEIAKFISENFVVAKINYSRENKNEEILTKFKYPQRFGFPVFVVLDGEGNYLHTQNSVYLEEGKGYSKKAIMEFFKAWSPAALDPASYEKK